MTAALARTSTTWRPACTDQPEVFFHQDGDRSHGWWRLAVAVCHQCPIRRACIEDELRVRTSNAGGGVFGGWVFASGRRVTPHPHDADLYARHYPRKAN